MYLAHCSTQKAGNVSRLRTPATDCDPIAGAGRVYRQADVRSMERQKHFLHHGWNGVQLRVLTRDVSLTPSESVPVICEGATLCEFDLACIQGILTPSQLDQLRRAGTAADLWFSRSFHQGAGRGSLMVLSRYPITSSYMERFHVQSSCAQGSGSAGRSGTYGTQEGVGLVRLATPAGPVDVYTAALHTADDVTAAAQAFQLAHFVHHTARSPLSLLAVTLGGAGSTAYALQLSVAALRDRLRRHHREDSSAAAQSDCNGFAAVFTAVDPDSDDVTAQFGSGGSGHVPVAIVPLRGPLLMQLRGSIASALDSGAAHTRRLTRFVTGSGVALAIGLVAAMLSSSHSSPVTLLACAAAVLAAAAAAQMDRARRLYGAREWAQGLREVAAELHNFESHLHIDDAYPTAVGMSSQPGSYIDAHLPVMPHTLSSHTRQ
ncbi:hypothetical protein JKP88DRAFT_312283 [Tribonema minus]|uniref:Transmembrane protein n=1 Tax=Tribonema minus TaxID=303371 RepID=A0A836CHH4_9STRA|nr:hypothetical protein JKP88DRAFT_312283 [Tribonema minus]